MTGSGGWCPAVMRSGSTNSRPTNPIRLSGRIPSVGGGTAPARENNVTRRVTRLGGVREGAAKRVSGDAYVESGGDGPRPAKSHSARHPGRHPITGCRPGRIAHDRVNVAPKVGTHGLGGAMARAAVASLLPASATRPAWPRRAFLSGRISWVASTPPAGFSRAGTMAASGFSYFLPAQTRQRTGVPSAIGGRPAFPA